jgi:putative membrane protein
VNYFWLFAFLAAALHAGFFVLETVVWGTPAANRIFRVSAAEAKTMAVFAKNQGFYNLFLALGVVGAKFFGQPAIAVFCCGVMIGAAFALIATNAKMVRGALLQGGPPALALIARYLGYG